MPIDPNTGAPLPYPEDQMAPPMGAPPMGDPMGGPPPELLAMLAGAQGAPPGPAGPPMPEGPQFKDPSEALRDLFQLVKSHPYLSMETDDADLAQLQKILSSMQDLLAKNQKQAESALGVGPAQKFMMKQSGAQGLPVG